ncbi:MAG: hypothetical protein ACI9S8_002459 [Chlamydiales bacterium]|jgi:hypothetical protein
MKVRMNEILRSVLKLFLRLRYPVSLPEDVIDALGIEASHSIDFQEFMEVLSNPRCNPKNLSRFMPRRKAEALFTAAVKKERFRHESLYSYYFSDSWVEFVLHFDNDSRLRRLYIHHKDLCEEQGVELLLQDTASLQERTPAPLIEKYLK